jgi:PadR family transcriptional regulator, regulatory protein PadR
MAAMRYSHGRACLCSHAIGNVNRFVEPIVLLMLKEKGYAYGYGLLRQLSQYALTDARIDRSALYRTLRSLEHNRYVTSTCDLDSAGPTRRIYFLTRAGQQRLDEWAEVMEQLGEAMKHFAQKAKQNLSGAASA